MRPARSVRIVFRFLFAGAILGGAALFGSLAAGGLFPARAQGAEEGGRGDEKNPREAPGKATAEKKHDLETWGQITAVRGTDFWELKYLEISGRTAKRMSAFAKVSEDAKFLDDRLIRVTDVKEGDRIWIFGKRFESEAPSLSGHIGVDRQMKNVACVTSGEGVTVNDEYKDPRDAELRWYEVEVTKPGPSLSVLYESHEYKVVMLRSAPVVRREKAEEKKELKSRMYVYLEAEKTGDRPDTGRTADEKKESYEAKRVVLPDPRLNRSYYPMLYK